MKIAKNPGYLGRAGGMGVYFSESPRWGGGEKLWIRMRKIKELVNNTSILAIFSLKL